MRLIPSLFLFIFIFLLNNIFGQGIQSPEEFLGYKIGDKFTYHHRVVDYYEYVAAQSSKVDLIPYGQTNERRPLMVAVVTAEKNKARIEEIRTNNLKQAKLMDGETAGESLPIVWLSYNVHGDESVSMEAALEVLHTLATSSRADISNWLNDMVIILDPCINPDGRDRYAHFYNQFGNTVPNARAESFEHGQPWPGGRYNHYLFDLNRDWAWQTQVESQQRMPLYRQWMPQVHVDFHEMGYNSPYFFAPASKPYHDVITPWQREFQDHIGRNHAKYFDQEGWLYFTKEVFDLLYPSYGDSWPIYNGAIGMTYEQGGGGRGGLAVITGTGDTLTLRDRIDHHYTTSLSTIETAHTHRVKLLDEFGQYFSQGIDNPEGKYKSYIIRGTNETARLQAFCELLDKQGIKYGTAQGGSRTYRGFDYQQQKTGTFSIKYNDIIISAYQPLSKLVKVLLEPNTFVEDSATYDLTAWSLPYVYNLEAYATEERVNASEEGVNFRFTPQAIPDQKPLAYLAPWKDSRDVAFLSQLYTQGLSIRTTDKAITQQGKIYPPGTLIILRSDNRMDDFDQKVVSTANQFKLPLSPTYSGYADEGPDFGSSSVRYLKKPKVAMLAGDGTIPTSAGAVWHYFEQVIQYPVNMLNTAALGNIDLNEFDVLVIPASFLNRQSASILAYVRSGGKVVVFDQAISLFTRAKEEDKYDTELGKALAAMNKENKKKEETDTKPGLKKYSDRRRERLTESVEGSIFKVMVDETHPLAYGIGPHTYFMKRNSNIYPMLSDRGWTAGIFPEDAHVSGFVGNKLKKKIPNTMAMGVENLGRGSIIYISDSPVIRAFWYNGQLLLGNAIFMTD